VIALIKEAVASGARKRKACELLALSLRTVERWEKPDGLNDKRHCAVRAKQPNALTEKEKEEILEVVNSKKYCGLAPCKIVPALADEGRYIASASAFYRLLRATKQLAHRRQSKPAKHHKPKAYTATGSNQVWSWDISYLPTTLLGSYYYLYLVTDIYSRKIVCWSIHERESAELASQLVQQACLDESIDEHKLVLHSDNGKPMKGGNNDGNAREAWCHSIF
jgi:putative transposase